VIILFFPEPIIFARSISNSRAIFLTAGPAFIPLKSIEAFSILCDVFAIGKVSVGEALISSFSCWVLHFPESYHATE